MREGERCRSIKRAETANALTHLPNEPPARRCGRKGEGQRRQGRGVVSRGAAKQASLKQASCTGRRQSSYGLGLYLIYRLSEKGKLLSVVPRHNYHNLRTQYHIRHIQVSKSEALASSVRSNPDCPETQADSACIEGLKHPPKGTLARFGRGLSL